MVAAYTSGVCVPASRPTRLDYATVADAETLEPVTKLDPGNILLIAAYLGQTRLIDNLLLS